MSDGASTGEVVGIMGAIVAGLGLIGGGIKWLLTHLAGRADSRSVKLQAWHVELAEREATLDRRLEARLATLETDQASLRGENKRRLEENSALRMAFELVASALRAIDPVNTALSRAEQILQSAFPLAPIIPPDMSTTLTAIEIKGKAVDAASRAGGASA